MVKINELEKRIGEDVVVKQIKGIIGCVENQRKSIKGLGLKGIGSKRDLKLTRDVFGMIRKVAHLVEVV